MSARGWKTRFETEYQVAERRNEVPEVLLPTSPDVREVECAICGGDGCTCCVGIGRVLAEVAA